MIITEPAQAAASYLQMGITPVPVTSRGKAPSISGWPDFRPDANKLTEYFPTDSNIGLLLGSASNHLVSIDMDWDECGLLYDLFFPDTPVFCRAINGIGGDTQRHWRQQY